MTCFLMVQGGPRCDRCGAAAIGAIGANPPLTGGLPPPRPPARARPGSIGAIGAVTGSMRPGSPTRIDAYRHSVDTSRAILACTPARPWPASLLPGAALASTCPVHRAGKPSGGVVPTWGTRRGNPDAHRGRMGREGGPCGQRPFIGVFIVVLVVWPSGPKAARWRRC